MVIMFIVTVILLVIMLTFSLAGNRYSWILPSITGLISIIMLFILVIRTFMSFKDVTKAAFTIKALPTLAIIAPASFIILTIYLFRLFKQKRRELTYTDEDAFDDLLIDYGLHPVQLKNRKKYNKKRKKNRKGKRLNKELIKDYRHIQITDDIHERLSAIWGRAEEEEDLVREITHLGKELARLNNPSLNWSNPTVRMTQCMYRDIPVLFDEIDRIRTDRVEEEGVHDILQSNNKI